jgi:hypothetical protein
MHAMDIPIRRPPKNFPTDVVTILSIDSPATDSRTALIKTEEGLSFTLL